MHRYTEARVKMERVNAMIGLERQLSLSLQLREQTPGAAPLEDVPAEFVAKVEEELGAEAVLRMRELVDHLPEREAGPSPLSDDDIGKLVRLLDMVMLKNDE